MNALAYRYPSGKDLGDLSDLVCSKAASPHRSIWIGPLFLHHIEAPVRLRRDLSLSAFARGILQAMPADAPIQISEFAVRLGIAPALLRRAIHDLHHHHGLVQPRERDAWQRHADADDAIKNRKTSRETTERRTLHFLERGNSALPHFVQLNHAPFLLHHPTNGWSFHPRTLHACFAQAGDWKQRHRFPTDFAPPDALEGDQRLIIDQAEWLPALLVEADEWQLFGMRPTEPKLVHDDPVARWSPMAAREALNGLTVEPTADEWRAAWRAACATAGVGAEELPGCDLVAADLRLTVAVPPSLGERVQSLNGHWCLAGNGPLRRAARIELAFPTASP